MLRDILNFRKHFKFREQVMRTIVVCARSFGKKKKKMDILLIQIKS